MRIIEPKQFKANKKSASPYPKRIAVGLVVVAAVAGLTTVFLQPSPSSRQSQKGTELVTIVPEQKPAKNTPKIFTGNQFRDLYRQLVATYPNTQSFPDILTITGNLEADKRIQELAESRGFQATRIPVTALTKTNEPMLKGETDDLLQPLAFKGWQELKAAAKADNIPLALLSAYRSPDWQRNLFMSRLGGAATPEQIAAGQGDDAVIRVLTSTSVPGYSRHHTGYTVDFWCEDGAGTFGNSSCNRWLEANNYLNAKKTGWIPSYPKDADEQGPEPEPWEYVWVGREVLFE